jgi:hypothetical protein
VVGSEITRFSGLSNYIRPGIEIAPISAGLRENSRVQNYHVVLHGSQSALGHTKVKGIDNLTHQENSFILFQ